MAVNLLELLNDLETKAKAAKESAGKESWDDHISTVSDFPSVPALDLFEACSPDTVLALITALREAHEVIEGYTESSRMGVDLGQPARAFLERYSSGR